jgi:hypothetical protein
MPPLSEEQLDALRADIAAHGVRVPITVDQSGRILDGNNRAAIAAELGIDCPQVVTEVADDNAAIDIALTLNCARRQLTREQRRELVRAELARRPSDSDRAIARRLGCSPSTVGSVRRVGPEVSNLDTAVEAEKRSLAIQQHLEQARAAIFATVGMALTNHVTVSECIAALTLARMRFERQHASSPEAADIFRRTVFDYVTEVVAWPETTQQFPPHPGARPTPEERAWLIEAIVYAGGGEDGVES